MARDCLRHLKVCYYLDRRIEPEFFDGFAEANIKVQAFSRYSPEAKDHFVLQTSRCHASGILGEKIVVCVFHKLSQEPVDARRSEFESTLLRYESAD